MRVAESHSQVVPLILVPDAFLYDAVPERPWSRSQKSEVKVSAGLIPFGGSEEIYSMPFP